MFNIRGVSTHDLKLTFLLSSWRRTPLYRVPFQALDADAVDAAPTCGP